MTTALTKQVGEGEVKPLSPDERLLRKAVARCLKAQVAEVHGRLIDGVSNKGGEGSGNFGHSGRPGEVGGSGGGGLQSIPIVSGKISQEKQTEIIATAKELVGKDQSGDEFGFRMLPYDGKEGVVGSKLESSFHWEEGNFTGKEIGATSVVGIKNTDDIEHAFDILKRSNYLGRQLALVRGGPEGSGEDIGERLLSDAEIVAVWDVGGKDQTKSLKAASPSNTVPSSTKAWDAQVVKEIRPIWFGLFKKGGDQALKQIRKFPKHARKMAVFGRGEMAESVGVDINLINKAKQSSIVIPDWIEDPDVLDALEREMFKFAQGIDQTTADALRGELMDGMENGETISQLANRISDISDEWVEGWRSEMIARTETARAFTEGHIEAWKSTGVVSRKVWVAAGDACPFCQEMDGTVVDLEDSFFDQGDEQTAEWRGQEIAMGHDYSDVNGPPLHPNCRCVLVAELSEPVTEEET
jgi:hypothetical protein